MEFINFNDIKQMRTDISIEEGTDHQKEIKTKDIAIIGMAAKLPLADDADAYWENIVSGFECVRDFPESRKKNAINYLKLKGINSARFNKGAFLEDIESFDEKLFHLTPREAQLMDPRQRLFLEEAFLCIEDAGYDWQKLRGKRIAVYGGFSNLGGESYLDMMNTINPKLQEIGGIGNLDALIPSRISYFLDFKGPSMILDTACSSSLVALHTACASINSGECEAALVGSVRLHFLPTEDSVKVGIESKDGYTRAFDDNATGTGIGEGAVCLLIKTLDKAIEDKDHIYAVIKSSAINQDGNSVGITAPNAEAQAAVIESALDAAGVHPEDISYIEAHGTGTNLGDPIEIDGITKAFSKYTNKKQFCAIGSVKNNIGHLYEASGLASVIKCVYALNSKLLPPTVNYQKANSKISFENSPVYVNTKTRYWDITNGKRMCGISSFGFSGTNCHMILSEPASCLAHKNNEKVIKNVLLLSAENMVNIESLVKAYLDNFPIISQLRAEDICFTAAIGRPHFNYRLSIIFKDFNDLKEKLKNIINLGKKFESVDIQWGNVSNEKKLMTDFTELYEDDDALQRIALFYINGIDEKWREYFKTSCNRVRLPLTPLDRKRYWINMTNNSSSSWEELKDFSSYHLIGRNTGEYSAVERQLGNIIYELLGYDELSVVENFYTYGGDSILAIRMTDKINNCFDARITVADIFSYPTIEKLAAYIEKTKLDNNVNFEKAQNQLESKDIAIIGMAGEFPGAVDIDEFWNQLLQGNINIREIDWQREKLVKAYLGLLGVEEDAIEYEKMGYLDNITLFDNEFFNISQNEAILMDPVQRRFLQVGYAAMENAGYGGDRLKGSNTGIFIGYSDDYKFNYRRFIYDSAPELTKDALAGNLNSMLGNRLAYIYDFRGPCITIDTACSSSLVALREAIKSLFCNECTAAIVAGIKIKLIPIRQHESNVGVESLHGVVRPFDEYADGTIEGESVNAIIIKPAQAAVDDGDHIYAIIKGSAINQDGSSMGIMAPRAETQKEVLIRAWEEAKISPETLDYIETHGTGTKLGDLIEYEGLKKAFNSYTDTKQYCALSSLKPNCGHLFQASGLASIIKATLCLSKRYILPMDNFICPNKLMDFENSPFYINLYPRKWEKKMHPRRCGVSSFGLSGTNAHVVLEEYVEDRGNLCETFEYYIFVLSAKTKKSLEKIIKIYINYISNNRNINLYQMSYTLFVGRGHYDYRVALIFKNSEELIKKLTMLYENLNSNEAEFIYFKYISGDGLKMEKTRELEVSYYGKLSKLKIVCEDYVSGIYMKWGNLFEQTNTIELPVYQFDEKENFYEPSKFCLNSVEKERHENSDKEYNAHNICESIEESILKIFRDVTNNNNGNEESNFFEMGGDSLKATIAAAKIYDKTGIVISLSDILSNSTAKKLSQVINERSGNLLKGVEIKKIEAKENYDLSINQMDLWISAQVFEGKSALNISWITLLHGFNISILRQALRATIDRQIILKSYIHRVDGVPQISLYKDDIFEDIYQEIEVSKVTANEIIDEEVRTQFELENSKLVRIRVLKLSDDERILVFIVNHIISDWWSMDVLAKEIIANYKALYFNGQTELPELSINYFDYAAYFNNFVENDEENKDYWKKILGKEIPLLNLKTDYVRKKNKGQTGLTYCTEFKESIKNRLQMLADLNQGTTYMILLTGVYCLLHLYSGEEDIIIGTNTSGREHPQLQNLVGYFVNVLPLRVNIKKHDTFSVLFDKVRDTVVGAFSHQTYPFVMMLEDSNIQHADGHTPVFDVLVQYLGETSGEGKINDSIFYEEIHHESYESKYDLVFNFQEHKGRIKLELEYSDELFERKTIEKMVSRLKKIYEKLMEGNDISVEELSNSTIEQKITFKRRKTL